jgi:phenylacetate-CoA ligase
MDWTAYKSLYYHLPAFLQNAACTAYGWNEAKVRFGDAFHKRLEFLSEAEGWGASEIEAYQNEKLRDLITHAYENVPYYRGVMQQRNVHPRDIRTKGDLHKLPILTKEDVRNNADQLVAHTADRRRLIKQHTSGTTGKSLHFYKHPDAIAFQWAVWWRHRKRFDIEFGAPHANFTGRPVVDPRRSRPPYWRWNHAFNQAMIPMQQITPEKVPAIVDFLNQHEFAFYVGYPSIMAPFAATAREQGLQLERPPQVVFSGAEKMYRIQQRQIERFTGAPITDQYGTAEGCANASQCREGVYHEDFEFGIIEQPKESGAHNHSPIICTGFASPEFPFIRYEIGDAAAWAPPESACACGRSSPVIEDILGRLEDYIVTPEGHRVMRLDYIFKDTQDVKESQVVQYTQDEIIIRIVQRPSYSTEREAHMCAMVHDWISPRLDVKFEYVDQIEREPSGKLRAVKSFLDDPSVTIEPPASNRTMES